MPQYFQVTGNTINLGPIDLPTSWRNISGLNLLSNAELAIEGWLPEVLVGFEPFDPETEVRRLNAQTVAGDKVNSVYNVRPMTPPELDGVQHGKDQATLATSAEDTVIVLSAVIDTLVALGLITLTDIEAIARGKAADLKVLADRVIS